MNATDTPTRIDGRKSRRAENRERALEACRRMMCAGDFQPSMMGVARACGLSLRSIFEYFGDVESMRREALDEATRDCVVELITGGRAFHFEPAALIHAAVYGRPLSPPAT